MLHIVESWVLLPSFKSISFVLADSEVTLDKLGPVEACFDASETGLGSSTFPRICSAHYQGETLVESLLNDFFPRLLVET